jgi:hypothetical protein
MRTLSSTAPADRAATAATHSAPPSIGAPKLSGFGDSPDDAEADLFSTAYVT